MNIGRISQAALDRCVWLPFHLHKVTVVAGAVVLGPSASVSAPLGGFLEPPLEMVLSDAVDQLAAKGVMARCLQVHFIVPAAMEEGQLKQLFTRTAQFCARRALVVSDPDAFVSDALLRPVAAVSVSGSYFPEVTESFLAHRLHIREGELPTQLVMAGYASAAGTRILANALGDVLSRRFSPGFLRSAKDFDGAGLAQEAAGIACRFSPQLMLTASEGGIFRALWTLAQQMEGGFLLDLKAILLRQESVELCEALDLNPYQLYSSGVLLVVTERGEGLCRALTDAGIPGAVLGNLTRGAARVLLNGADARYLEKPQQEMLWVYAHRQTVE